MSNWLTKYIGASPKQWTITTLGFYFLVILHYFQFNHGGSGLNHPMNPLGWIVVSIIIGYGLLQISKSGEFRFNYLSKNIALGCGLLLIPLAYSGDTGWYSHQRLLGLFAGLALLLAFQQMNFKRHDYFRLFSFIVAGIFIESILSLVQFYILPYFSQLNLNLSRPTALFFQANVAATFFVMGLLLSITLLQRRGKVNRKLNYLYYACTFTCAVVICLIQSRTGFISALVGISLLLCYKSSVNKKWLALTLLGVVIAIMSLATLDRFTRNVDVYGHPGLRTQIYDDSLAIINEKPIIGHGYGSFARVYIEHQATKLGDIDNYQPVYKLSHPHNEILLWVIEGGGIALLALILICGTVTWMIFYNQRHALLILALLFPLGLHCLTEFPFYQSVAAWMIFLLFLCFSLPKTQIKTIPTSKVTVYHTLTVLLITLTTIYMGSIMISQKRISKVLYSQNGSALLNTQLPFLSSDFEEMLNKDKLTISMRHGIDSEVQQYQQWAIKLNNVFPRANRYKNLLLAALYFKQFELAENILADAQRLYPTQDWQEQEQWVIDRKNEPKHKN